MTIDGWKPGLYAFTIALALFVVFFSVVTMARAQEGMGLEGVSQKELEGLPVREGGVLAQTWDWFIELLGFEVPDNEVIKRSILEQDLAIDDVRLVIQDNSRVEETTRIGIITTINEQCTWDKSTSNWSRCIVETEGEIHSKNTYGATASYQVIVTPTETYDVPDRTTCYDEGVVVVCESTLRCDGLPGIEFGCEHVIIKKEPLVDGKVDALNVGSAPIRNFVSRKQVLTSPKLIIDETYTKHLPENVVTSMKAELVSIDEVMNE